MTMTILFISKTTEWCKAAQRFMKLLGHDTLILEGERGALFPEDAKTWEGDYIISFLSSWVIPSSVLLRARKAAINFHPAPPEYPGIGCYNFALYDGVHDYGVTCHHMASKVDTGKIIKVLRFPVLPNDTVASLKDRSMTYLLNLFYDVASQILENKDLPVSTESWTRSPYTRKELDALCEIKTSMPSEEITRRVRATFYPGYPGPYIDLNGHKFELR